MATFVIVHGGFGGGWEWTPVALALRVQGHIVFTPTLTGMGERVHLGPGVGLATHVEDVVAVLEFEDLDEVILCGASCGGMPVTGAADRVADRIRLIAYVDALVPAAARRPWTCCRRGSEPSCEPRPTISVTGGCQTHPPCCRRRGSSLTRSGALRRPPAEPAGGDFHRPDSPHRGRRPRRPCLRPLHSRRTRRRRRSIEAMAVRARTEGWLYRELSAPHDPHLFDPAGTAAVLHELAATASTEPERSTVTSQK